jgi:hypothetical protein
MGTGHKTTNKASQVGILDALDLSALTSRQMTIRESAEVHKNWAAEVFGAYCNWHQERSPFHLHKRQVPRFIVEYI